MSRRSEVRTLLAGCAALLELMVGEQVLRFSSMTTMLGTPVDITLSELAIESCLPTDAETVAALGSQSLTSARTSTSLNHVS